MIIQINDGSKTYDIQNQNGEIVASVTFKPNDFNILRRVDAVVEEMEKIIESIKNIPPNSKAIAEKEDELKEKIDALFSADVSTPFFNILGAFSPVGKGRFFVEDVLEKLIGIVRTEYENETAKEKEKLNEYLAEYVGGESK
jgi:hypothetical protein